MSRPVCEQVSLTLHRELEHDYYSLIFSPFKAAGYCLPGQFLHVRIPGTDIMFRRAFSVASVSQKDDVEIILKVFGRGSRALSRLRPGDAVDILGPLGNGFRMPPENSTVVMVAGGVGFPPLLYLAHHLVEQGRDPQSIQFFYGGRTNADIIEQDRISSLGVGFHPVTEDGSLGEAGMVTTPVEEFLKDRDKSQVYLYGCGPEGMLRATDGLARNVGVAGQLSLEAPMPCGIGVCLGCVVPLTEGGHARVCLEGPVFDIGEVAL